MTDIELTRALERCEVPAGRFHHLEHLRVALVYLNESATVSDAVDRMASTLRRFAASAGRPEQYSQAMTEFWMYQMAAARALMPDAPADNLFAACPHLLDKSLLPAYYSGDAAQPGAPHPSSHAQDRSVPGESR
jgi:hypothetical protein